MVVQYGIIAAIAVNGQKLPEHDCPKDSPGSLEPRTVSKYIEVRSEANFEVFLESVPRPPKGIWYAPHMCVKIHLDGVLVESCVVDWPFKETLSKSFASRNREGKWVRRPFRFTEILIDSESEKSASEIHHMKGKLMALGAIQVSLYRVRSYTDKINHETIDLGRKLQESPIPEKALKGEAKSHRAKLGDEVASKRPLGSKCDYVDGEKEKPFMRFNFKYRSRKSLQMLTLIPRSPEPTPDPLPLEDRPLEELTLEEARELLRQQQKSHAFIKSEPYSLKRKRDSDHEAEGNLGLMHKKRLTRDNEYLNSDGITVVDLSGSDEGIARRPERAWLEDVTRARLEGDTAARSEGLMTKCRGPMIIDLGGDDDE